MNTGYSMKITRRTAIKGLAASVASATIANGVKAGTVPKFASKDFNPDNTDTFKVQVAHRWGNESLAAVIKNTSPHAATINNVNSLSADYGRFNFSTLTQHGPLTLAAGEEVIVPFEVMGTPVNAFGHFDNRLQKRLQEALVISTENASAKVTTTLNPRIV